MSVRLALNDHQLVGCFAGQRGFGVGQTHLDDARFRDDLGADSLDAFELLLALEDAFGLEIPDDAADPMQRVSDAVTYIEAQVAVGHTRRPEGHVPDSLTRNARS